jgi:alpha-1,6-mannosyltransferase
LSGLVFNFVNDKASDWGIMSRHYYFTNSLPKLLGGTAVPLAFGGLTWMYSLYLGSTSQTKNTAGVTWNKWAKKTGRDVGEVIWTFGPGVVGLVGGMSLIGHKVSTTLIPNICS